MKKLSVLLIALSFSQFASALTLNELAGSYKVTHTEIPVVNIVKISADGKIALTESSPYGKLECSGKGKLVNDQLSSSVKCTDGQVFTQKINLSKVKNLNKFKATVFSSLYGQELEMNFERL